MNIQTPCCARRLLFKNQKVLNSFKKHINQSIPLLINKKVYIAVSGGIDSMVLLHLCQQLNLSPIALHCNFELRGDDSNKDEALVLNYCESNNIAVFSKKFDTKKEAEIKRLSIQECARNLRYDWFKSFLAVAPNTILLTAHHLDDSIETFFINLFRGTGLKGLTGIPFQRGQIFRPLLPYSRNDIEKYVLKHNVSYREDSSNSDTKYTRNKIRHHILPEINKMTPNFAPKMDDLMADLNEIDQFLETYSAELKSNIFKQIKGIDIVHISKLSALPLPIIQKILRPYNVQRHQIKEIHKLSQAQTGATFKNTDYTFLKDRDYVLIKKTIQKIKCNKIINHIPGTYQIEGKTFSFSIINQSPIKFESHIAYLDYDKAAGPFEIKNSFESGKIQPLGMKGNQLISDLLINKKLNKFEKEEQLILKYKNDIIWVVGIAVHHNFRLQKTTKRILKIEMSE